MEKTRLKQQKEVQNCDMRHDFLSELPEHLLHHILSHLTMKDVISTSFLARRWRDIWLYVPCLNFLPTNNSTFNEMAFITRSLLLHKGSKLQKLSISFIYEYLNDLGIDSWIHFALTRDVNELYLDANDLFRDYPRYQLPQIIFSFRSLTFLSLKNCDFDFEGNSINFKLISLKILSLEEVNFLGGAISDLINSSPILECLSLKNCRMRENLDLFIKNVCTKTLKIHETHNCFSRYIFAVNAPFITSFELLTTMSRKSYVIGEMQSLESAIVDCTQCHPSCTLLKSKAKEKDCSIVKVLGKFCHVKDLRLSGCYLQALSRSEDKGLGFLSFDVTLLRISTGWVKLELPGIAYMLRHSPNVETLIIAIDDKRPNYRKSNSSGGEYWRLQDPNFINLLCNLKTVTLYNFMTDLTENQICNWEIHELADCLEDDMKFLRFLLRNSKVLERMTITTTKRLELGRETESKKLKMLFHLTQELMSGPRASRDAEISFR